MLQSQSGFPAHTRLYFGRWFCYSHVSQETLILPDPGESDGSGNEMKRGSAELAKRLLGVLCRLSIRSKGYCLLQMQRSIRGVRELAVSQTKVIVQGSIIRVRFDGVH